MKRKPLTITVIERDGKVLLGLKKRGYAEGVWNGFGGKIEPGETPEEAMMRELWEESSLRSTRHEKVGYIEFSTDIEDYISECHIYKIHEYEGELVETEEMRPEWFDMDALPYDAMWPDDIHWLPPVLAGKKVKGRFYLKDNKTIETFELVEVDNI